MDRDRLRYPLKSHRKEVKLPSESDQLAELMGIVFGDGGINNDWQVNITLNSIADKTYSEYVSSLLLELFGVNAVSRKRKGMNALLIQCSSTSIVDFLVSKGAVRGSKVLQQVSMPAWIARNSRFKRYFVRGLVDTDGCLYVHRHSAGGNTYKNIGFCFSNKSMPLISAVAETLEEFDIKPHISKGKNKVYLYSQKAVLDYLNIFGSSNPRILEKYQEWTGA